MEAVVKNNKPYCPNCDEMLSHVTIIRLYDNEYDLASSRCGNCGQEHEYLLKSDLSGVRKEIK